MNTFQHMAIGLAASAMLFAVASNALADDAERAAICKTAELWGDCKPFGNRARMQRRATRAGRAGAA